MVLLQFVWALIIREVLSIAIPMLNRGAGLHYPTIPNPEPIWAIFL